MTMLVVTHEMGLCEGGRRRVVFMDQGVIVEEGPPRQVHHRPQPRAETREFLRSIIP